MNLMAIFVRTPKQKMVKRVWTNPELVLLGAQEHRAHQAFKEGGK